MYKNISIFFIVVLLMLLSVSSYAFKTMEIYPDSNYTTVQDYLYVFTPQKENIEIAEIINIPQSQFFPINDVIPKLQRNKSYWVVLNLKNVSNKEKVFYLIAGITQEIDFYDPNELGLYEKKQYGYSIPDNKKEYSEIVSEVVGIHFKPNQTKLLYFRVKSKLNLKPSPLFKISEQVEYKNYLERFALQQGLFHGLLWMMIAYMLFLYINVRDKSYLYYIFYAITASVAIFILIGFPRNYFFRDIEFNVLYSELMFQIGSIFYMLLFREALDIKKLSRLWSKLYFVFIAIGVFGVVSTFICLLFDFYLYNLISQIHILIQLLIYIVIIIGFFQFKTPSTLCFFIGTLMLTIGALIITIGLLFLGEPFLKFFPIFQLGVSLELLFFAIGLSKRFQLIEQQKRIAQRELIKELKEKEALQQKINEDLEELVTERTKQITQSKLEIEKQRTTLAFKHFLLEESNRKLTENLEYAGFIQNALLDDFKKVKQSFKESFIIFKPHSYVSGDFYMFANLPNNKTLIIVADCTGHGVPGAILTIIAQDFLQDIIYVNKHHQPAIILAALEEKIKTRLLNVSGNKTLHEGLDASVLLIDKDERMLHFCGAKLPLFFHCKDEMLRVKGCNYGIGGEFVEITQEKQFFQKSFSYNIGDSVFLSTDGYIDQLSEKNKKYLTKRFMQTLASISLDNAETQRKYLLDEFEQWKGKKEQIDDILIVGIKL